MKQLFASGKKYQMTVKDNEVLPELSLIDNRQILKFNVWRKDTDIDKDTGKEIGKDCI